MRYLDKTNGSFKHKTGNFITGITKIFDGVCCLITLGNYSLSLTLKWLQYRMKKKFLLDNK